MKHLAFIIRYLSLISFLFFQLVHLNGQPTNLKVQDVVMPAPNAAALGKYSDIPVGYYTGTPSISIPIYTVAEGPLNLPISLSYHASGVRVAETASWVGIGWSLNAGGMITRTTQGIDDDLPFGFYHYGANDINLGQNSSTLEDYINGVKDPEPDIFSFNFGGYSGKFFFDSNNQFYFAPKQDLKLEVHLSNGTTGTFERFVIITPDGTRYHFGKDPVDTNRRALEYSTSTGENSNKATASSWCLVRIESADQNYFIKLIYEEEKYSYYNLGNRRYINAASNGPNCNGETNGVESTSLPSLDQNHHYVRTNIRGQRLAQIINSTNTSTIDFLASGTNRLDLRAHIDGNGTYKKLDEIRISSGNFCSKFKLTHTYFEDKVATSFQNEPFAKRLKLISLQEMDCNESVPFTKPPHIFEYEESIQAGVSFLPHRLSKAQDHWGYYNGADGSKPGANNENLIVNVPQTIIEKDGQTWQYGTANRDTDFTYSKVGSLSKVTYPTGGSTSFTFESHQYEGETPGLMQQYWQVDNADCSLPDYNPNNCCGVETITDYYTFTSIDQINQSHFQLGLNNGCTATVHKVRIDIYSPTNTFIGGMEFDTQYGMSTDWLPLSILDPNGNLEVGLNYRFELRSENGLGYFKLGEQQITISAIPVGGLRIKSIKTHDGVSTSNDIIRTFSYLDINGVESGKLFFQPDYGQYLSTLSICTFNGMEFYTNVEGAIFYENSYVPLSNFEGNHIAYTDIKETFNGNGYKTYQYELEIDQIRFYNPSYPITPYEPKPYNGKLLESKTFNQNDSQVAGTINTPELDPLITIIPQTLYKITKAIFFPSLQGGSGVNFKPTAFYSSYTMETSIYRLHAVENILDGVSTMIEYGYDNDNDHFFPTSTLFTNSDGQIYKTTNEYAFDFTEPVYLDMQDRNMISSPIRTIQEVTNGSTTDQIDGTETNYNLISGFPRPTIFKRYEVSWDDQGNLTSGSWNVQGTILAYDTNIGKPTQYRHDGWDIEYYTWNPTNRLIQSRVYQDYTWSYDYYTNTRLVSKITDIDGQYIDYHYDGLMRLDTVVARTGKVKTYYEYGYKGIGGNLENYVKTTLDLEQTGSSALDLQETFQYIDGLGRPIQTIRKGYTPNEKDLVTVTQYDNQGRPARVYEPFESTLNDGSFVATLPTGFDDYTETQYYDSPLNRISSVTPPGWPYPTSYSYGKNTAIANIGGLNYPIGSLTTQTIIDGNGQTSTAFKDKKGRLVLQQNPENTKTQYIYDDKDRVVTILPPGATTSNLDLIYTYLYDESDNILSKKIPGMDGAIRYVYDSRDLPLFTQDPNMLLDNHWLQTKYDTYGRPLQTGFTIDTGTPNGPAVINELHTESIYYTLAESASMPTRLGKLKEQYTKILGTTNDWLKTYTDYDIYGRVAQSLSNNHLDLTAYSTTDTTICAEVITPTYDFADNVLTEERIHRHNSQSTYLMTRHDYDDEGRLTDTYFDVGTIPLTPTTLVANHQYTIKDELLQKNLGLISGNNYLQQCDYTYNAQSWLTGINPNLSGNDLFRLELFYDSPQSLQGLEQPDYAGNISQIIWQTPGSDAKTYGFTYDGLNRLTQADYLEYINGAGPTTSDGYKTTYSYDARGNILSLERFGQYSDGSNTLIGQIDDLGYTYSSASNRLQSIADNALDASAKMEGFNPGSGTGSYQYDNNGNLKQDPYKELTFFYNHLNLPDQTIHNSTETIEWLYDAAGNKLRKISPGVNPASLNLNTNPIPPGDYQANQIIASGVVEANSTVNLKATDFIELNSGFETENTADFTAEAVSSLPDPTSNTRDYVGGIEYLNGNIEAIYFSEGRVYYNQGIPRYEYYIKDHLGNTRIVFTADGPDADNDPDILQETHYYPFGLAMKGNWDGVTGTENSYRYNGIERNEEIGLNLDIAPYRMYDPAIGRWLRPDPFAEIMREITPYRFGYNNPLRYNDPLGLMEEEDDPEKREIQYDETGMPTEVRLGYNDAQGNSRPATIDVFLVNDRPRSGLSNSFIKNKILPEVKRILKRNKIGNGFIYKVINEEEMKSLPGWFTHRDRTLFLALTNNRYRSIGAAQIHNKSGELSAHWEETISSGIDVRDVKLGYNNHWVYSLSYIVAHEYAHQVDAFSLMFLNGNLDERGFEGHYNGINLLMNGQKFNRFKHTRGGDHELLPEHVRNRMEPYLSN